MSRIILGDCLEVMRGFADNQFDLVLTDPPYGIGASSMNMGFSRASRLPKSDWDSFTPTREYFDEIRRISKNQIIFGGNYFTDKLPPSGCWLVWDKGGSFKDRSFAECELAWTNLTLNTKIYLENPLASGAYKDKQHKTQKPIKLMSWCISLLPDTRTVLDPFMGSGTTLRACKDRGIDCTGIEINPDYVKIAEDRLKQEVLL